MGIITIQGEIMYTLTFSISTYLVYKAEKSVGDKRKLFIICAILLPVILAGLRDYSVGRDVTIYGNEWFWRASVSNSMLQYLSDSGKNAINGGYAVLNYFISRLFDDAHWFYFFLALFNMIILYHALKPFRKEISIPFAFLVFYFFYFNESLNMMRQTTAMLFVLLSAGFIRKHQVFRYLLCIFSAISFHTSAIIGIILYPLFILSNNKYRKIVTYLLFSAALFVVFNLAKLVYLLGQYGIVNYKRYSFYISNDYSVVGGRYIRIVFFTLIFLLFTVKKEKIIKSIPFAGTLYAYSVFSFVLSFLMITFSVSYIIRVAYYFDIFLLIYMPLVARSLKVKYGRLNKTVFREGLILLPFVTYWFFVFGVRAGGGTIPYRFMGFRTGGRHEHKRKCIAILPL